MKETWTAIGENGLEIMELPKSPADLDEVQLMEELEDSCRRWQYEQNCNLLVSE